MSSVSFVLPFPPRGLSPNVRLHHHERARLAASYRHSCRVDALNVRRDMEAQGMTFPLATPATILLTFMLPNKQRRDIDNLIAGFKAGLDGIVDSGLLADDSVWLLRLGVEAELGAEAAVRVRLEGAPE